MAIAFDKEVDIVGASTSITPTSGGTNPLLIIGTYDLTSSNVTVTVDGAPATVIARQNRVGGSLAQISLFYFLGAAAGSSHTVVIAGGVVNSGGICSYFGAKQSGQPDQFTTNTTASGTSLATSLTPTQTNEWAFSIMGAQNSITAGTGVTFRGGNNCGIGDSNGPITSGSPYSMTWTTTPAADIAVVMSTLYATTSAGTTNSGFFNFM